MAPRTELPSIYFYDSNLADFKFYSSSAYAELPSGTILAYLVRQNDPKYASTPTSYKIRFLKNRRAYFPSWSFVGSSCRNHLFVGRKCVSNTVQQTWPLFSNWNWNMAASNIGRIWLILNKSFAILLILDLQFWKEKHWIEQLRSDRDTNNGNAGIWIWDCHHQSSETESDSHNRSITSG